MARRLKHAAHENHERWLVSYADFITLLFAFFVVMFAASNADKKKVKAVSDSVREALDGGQFRAAVSAMMGRPPRSRHAAPQLASAPTPTPAAAEPANGVAPDLAPTYDFLKQHLGKELDAGQVQLRVEKRGLIISLREAAFFPSGDDVVRTSGYGSLEKISAALRHIPNPVRLEGHTDAVPIHNSRYHSNWELSVARSISMLELLSGRFDLPRNRFSVAGYAETAPVDSNESEDGRARNRRVDLVILAPEGIRAEPSRAASEGKEKHAAI